MIAYNTGAIASDDVTYVIRNISREIAESFFGILEAMEVPVTNNGYEDGELQFTTSYPILGFMESLKGIGLDVDTDA